MHSVVAYVQWLLKQKRRGGRVRIIPVRFSNSIITSTIGHHDNDNNESFSKIKLIKRSTRNTMNDTRLSDMCLLAVERDFEIDFEKEIDVFSLNHGNSRILLR